MQKMRESKKRRKGNNSLLKGSVVVIKLPVFHAGWLGYMALSIT